VRELREDRKTKDVSPTKPILRNEYGGKKGGRRIVLHTLKHIEIMIAPGRNVRKKKKTPRRRRKKEGIEPSLNPGAFSQVSSPKRIEEAEKKEEKGNAPPRKNIENIRKNEKGTKRYKRT